MWWKVHIRWRLNLAPPKIDIFPGKGTTLSIWYTCSNHWFSGDMLVFRGVCEMVTSIFLGSAFFFRCLETRRKIYLYIHTPTRSRYDKLTHLLQTKWVFGDKDAGPLQHFIFPRSFFFHLTERMVASLHSPVEVVMKRLISLGAQWTSFLSTA